MDRTYPLFTIIVSSLFAVNSALANDGHGLSDKPGQTPPTCAKILYPDCFPIDPTADMPPAML